jgi:hypothetical protein
MLGTLIVLFLCSFGIYFVSQPKGILMVAPFFGNTADNGQWLQEKLTACGPKALPAVMSAIRKHSPWVTTYACLPKTLKSYGEEAHKKLIAAVDSETDLRVKAFYISTLQTGFADFSRFDLWLDQATQDSFNSWALIEFRGEIKNRFPMAPDLRSESWINPEFVTWWKTNRGSRHFAANS